MFFPLESVPYTKRDQILVVIAANTCERAIGRVINQLGPARDTNQREAAIGQIAAQIVGQQQVVDETLVALFAVGASRALVTNQNWFYQGVEMLAVGAAAAGVAYGVGYLIAGITA